MSSNPGSFRKQRERKKGRGGDKQGTKAKAELSLLSLWSCIGCDKTCENENCIECFCCGKWSHQDCAGLSDDTFTELNRPSLQWVCAKCLEEEAGPKSKTDKLIEDMMKVIAKLTDRLDSIDAKLKSDSESEEKINEMIGKKVAEALDEEREREKRKKNIIIVNMKESAKTTTEEKKEDDLVQAKKMIEKVADMAGESLSDPVRLGREGGNRPRMLKLTVSSEKKKKEILKNAAKLNEGQKDQKKKIYINADYTPKERETFRALRAEKREREEKGEKDLIIRNGKILHKTDVQKTDQKTDRDNEDREEK